MKYLLALVTLSVISQPALAQNKGRQPLPAPVDVAAPTNPVIEPAWTPEEKSAIARAQDYLNGLQTLRARFRQSDPTGRESAGSFELKRPGRLRFVYDAPAGNLVVADGKRLYFWDAKLKTTSHAALKETLADLLARPHLDLSGEIKVQAVRRDKDRLFLTLVEAADPARGRIILSFQTKPFALASWQIVDPQGGVTDVALDSIETGISLADADFVYREPEKNPSKRQR